MLHGKLSHKVSAATAKSFYPGLLLFELLKLPDVSGKMILTCSRNSGNCETC